MSWWETLHLVTWWKRLGISAIKTGQDAPSWIWCTERLSFFGGGHIVLQRFVHVRCHFQPLPTKLVFAYFDRGSYIYHASFKQTFQHILSKHRLFTVGSLTQCLLLSHLEWHQMWSAHSKLVKLTRKVGHPHPHWSICWRKKHVICQ